MLVARIVGMMYLTAGCLWTWKWTGAWGTGRWRMTMRGLREHGIPGGLAHVICFVFWLYDGIAEIAFWPWGVRHEMRFRRWLRRSVAPAPSPSPPPSSGVDSYP